MLLGCKTTTNKQNNLCYHWWGSTSLSVGLVSLYGTLQFVGFYVIMFGILYHCIVALYHGVGLFSPWDSKLSCAWFHIMVCGDHMSLCGILQSVWLYAYVSVVLHHCCGILHDSLWGLMLLSGVLQSVVI